MRLENPTKFTKIRLENPSKKILVGYLNKNLLVELKAKHVQGFFSRIFARISQKSLLEFLVEFPLADIRVKIRVEIRVKIRIWNKGVTDVTIRVFYFCPILSCVQWSVNGGH